MKNLINQIIQKETEVLENLLRQMVDNGALSDEIRLKQNWNTPGSSRTTQIYYAQELVAELKTEWTDLAVEIKLIPTPKYKKEWKLETD